MTGREWHRMRAGFAVQGPYRSNMNIRALIWLAVYMACCLGGYLLLDTIIP